MNCLISRDDLFREYVVNGKAMHEIASEYGIATSSVFNYLNRYGIPGRRHPTDKVREKMSKSHKGRATRKDYSCSDETRLKISIARKGKFKKPSEFGGHKKLRSDGYIKVFVPNHPYCTKEGYVMEHILVMEKHIGRYITRDEVVHHKNHIRNDNRIENLQLMTFKEHAGMHMRERHEARRKQKGAMTY